MQIVVIVTGTYNFLRERPGESGIARGTLLNSVPLLYINKGGTTIIEDLIL